MDVHWPSFAVGAALVPALYGFAVAVRALRVNHVPCDTQPRPEGGLRVVITGSSTGLGFALAKRFVQLADSVVISSRSESACAKAAESLQAWNKGTVLTCTCDVSRPEQVEALAQFAKRKLGGIDVWVNNAGVSFAPKAHLADAAPERLQAVIDTNLTGSLLGTRAAMRVMHSQPAGGKVFLVDGAWGNPTPGNVAYGATKRGLTQVLRTLVAEAAQAGHHAAAVHIVSPGMVATDLLLGGVTPGRAARIVNILAEEADVVAAWLVPRMRGVTGTGRYFRYLTVPEVVKRLLTARGRRNRFLPETSDAKQA